MREQLLAAEKVRAIEWRDGALHLLDQRALPFEETWLSYHSAADVAEAIRSMVVRGAPAIGISAAYAIVLAVRARLQEGGDWRAALQVDFDLLAASRPTRCKSKPRADNARAVAAPMPRLPPVTRRRGRLVMMRIP